MTQQFNFKYYLPKINEKCLHKDSCKIFHNNAILTTPNWKKKQIFINKKMIFKKSNTQWNAYSVILF